MPEYALIEDGEVVSVGAEPDSWENPDGTTTSTPLGVETDPKVLAKAGYLPVEDRDVERPDGTIQDGFDYKVQKSKVIRTPRYVEFDPEVAPEQPLDPAVSEMMDRVAQAEEDRGLALQEVAELRGQVAALEQRVASLEGSMSTSESQSLGQAVRDLQNQVQRLQRG